MISEKCFFIKKINNYWVEISCNDSLLFSLSLVNRKKESENLSLFAKKVFDELEEYFCKKRKSFDIPTKTEGTEFQKSVWKEINKIPFGCIKTYSELAEAVGNRKAIRAVASACGRNPIAILTPCHRIVGINNLGGYAYGLKMKKELLELET